MYKIIACDLDETLISHDRSISKEISKPFNGQNRLVYDLCPLQEEAIIPSVMS